MDQLNRILIVHSPSHELLRILAVTEVKVTLTHLFEYFVIAVIFGFVIASV
jgi:hypothetical protein